MGVLLTVHMGGWLVTAWIMYWRAAVTEGPAHNFLTDFRRFLAFVGIASFWELWLVLDLVLKFKAPPSDDSDRGQ